MVIKINTNTISNFKTKKDYFIFIIALSYFLLITTIPFFEQITNAYLSMIFILFLLALIILSNPSKYIIFIIPISSVLMLEIINRFLLDITSIPLYIYGRSIWILPALLSYFLISNNNMKIIRISLYILFVGLFTTALTSYFGLLNDPMAARISATISDSKSVDAISLNMRNIGGFRIVYTLAAIYPMVVCLWKYKKINLFLFLILTISFGAYIFLSQYTTAIIFFFVGLVSLFLSKKLKTKKLMIIGILVVLLTIIFKSFTAEMFYSVSNNVQSITLAERFEYIGDFINGADVETDNTQIRFKLYEYSVDTFRTHLFTGNGYINDGSKTSGHSFILDTMAKYGIIGLLAVMIFFVHIYRVFYRPYSKEPFFGYMLYCFIFCIILGIINPIDSLLTIAFIIPLIGYVLSGKNNKINE